MEATQQTYKSSSNVLHRTPTTNVCHPHTMLDEQPLSKNLLPPYPSFDCPALLFEQTCKWSIPSHMYSNLSSFPFAPLLGGHEYHNSHVPDNLKESRLLNNSQPNGRENTIARQKDVCYVYSTCDNGGNVLNTHSRNTMEYEEWLTAPPTSIKGRSYSTPEVMLTDIDTPSFHSLPDLSKNTSNCESEFYQNTTPGCDLSSMPLPRIMSLSQSYDSIKSELDFCTDEVVTSLEGDSKYTVRRGSSIGYRYRNKHAFEKGSSNGKITERHHNIVDEVETSGPDEESKSSRRLRNSLASRKLRDRRKKEFEILEKVVQEKTQEAKQLNNKVALLRTEVKYLKEMLLAHSTTQPLHAAII